MSPATATSLENWLGFTLTVCVLGWLQVCPFVNCGRQHNNGNTVYLRDKILEWQCRAKCENAVTRFDHCLKQCQIEMMKMPRRGHCPFNNIFRNMNTPLHELSCLDNCNYDYDCPEVQKCCYASCGPVCISPWGIGDDGSLPPIPRIEEYTLIPREKKVEINSTINALQTNTTYYFHVESRYHIGLFLRPRKFGAWQYQPVDKIAELRDYNSKLFNTKVGFRLRPGRWYQVRVAAINAYGFRGYSEPSQAFTLPNHPKPPKKPADVKVASSHFDGKFCTINLIWCPSKSNLPVEKYKIIWALYIKSNDESFIYNETYVKDRHHLEIKHLLPESNYYIQVQALAVNGRRRLKSEPNSILFNTTGSGSGSGSVSGIGGGGGSSVFHSSPLSSFSIMGTQLFSSHVGGLLRCERDNEHHHHHFLRGGANTGLAAKHLYDEKRSLGTPSGAPAGHILLPIGHRKLSSHMDQHYFNDASHNNFMANGNYTAILRNLLELKYCFNRKNELIVNISGLPTRRGRIYELCPRETNCEEYNAVRATKDHLVFSKLNYNTTYTLKPRSEMTTSASLKGITFTIPPREYLRKDCQKKNLKCCKNEIKQFKTL